MRTGVDALGWKSDRLAREADLPVELIRALISRGAPVSSLELELIAEALGLDPVALRAGQTVQPQLPSVFLRHGPSAWQDFRAEDRDHLDRALEGARAWCELLRALGRTDTLQRRSNFVTVTARGPEPRDAARQGHDLAVRVRSAVGLGSEPLDDARALLEDRFGVSVVVAPLQTRSPAQAVLDADRVAASVVLNANDEERRDNPLLDRVHLVHELCHVLFDPTEPGRLHLVVEATASRRARGNALAQEVAQMLRGRDVTLEEARARGFAAEMLLPEAGLRARFGDPHKEADDARAHELVSTARMHFSTPWEIAVWHLANRGYIARSLARKLLYLGAEGRPEKDTLLPAVGAPSVALRRETLDALAEELITEGQARRLLRLPPGEPIDATR